MIIFWGRDLVQFYNESYSHILGEKHPAALGQTARECWPEIWDQIAPMLYGVLERGDATWSEDLLLQFNRSGAVEDLYFTFSYSPIRDQSGIVGVFCAVNETTANVHWKRDVQLRAQALVELNAARTDFFNNVSHEFRTPLTLMLAPLDDVLAQPERLDVELAETLNLVRRNGRRLQRLVNTLLDFSRIEAQRLVPERRAIDLGRFTSEVAGMFRSTFDSAGLELRLTVDGSFAGVEVDPRLWEELLLNLLSNAFKFTQAGHIAVSLQEVDGEARLRVSDTGCGMSREEAARAFERFWRGRNLRARTQEGSGIGLALVAEIAALHDGTASIASEEGEGTTVTVTIPLRSASGPSPLAERMSIPPPIGEIDTFVLSASRDSVAQETKVEQGRRPVVLVVDDNADLLAYLKRLLGDRYEVMTASDGEAAYNIALEAKPDIVLSDVMLPRLSGIELLRLLRANEGTKQMPVVLITARAGDHDRGAGVGADDYIVKPFSKIDLFLSIERQLLRSASRSEETARFRALADELPNLVWTFEANGRADWANKRTYAYTGLAPERLNDPEAWRELVEPDDFEGFLATHFASIEAGNSYELEFRLRHRMAPPERSRWHLVRLIPIRDEQGALLRWVGSATDVHDQRRAAAVLAEDLEREHKVAAAFQEAALPTSLPVAPGVTFSAAYRAAQGPSLVGGDWYDAFARQDGTLVISVGDAMGRGLGAAVVMSAVRQSIRAAAQMTDDTSAIVEAANAALRGERGEELVTAFVGIIDPVSATLVYSNAGHMRPLLVSAGETREVEGGGLPLGVFSGTPLTTRRTIALERPSMLVLYTDGLVESTGSILDGEARLREVLRGQSLAGAAHAAQNIVAAFGPTDDDLAVMTVALT